MIFTVPAPPSATPQVRPVVGSTTTRAVLLLLQVPPLTPSLNGIHAFWQNEPVPEIGVGNATVSVNVLLPQTLVAVIVVVPVFTPVTTPVTGSIVATDGLLLVHVPVGVPLLLSVVTLDWHITDTPDITVGAADTDTVYNADPQLLA